MDDALKKGRASDIFINPPRSNADDGFPAAAVNLNHFRLLRVVGRGAFGKVRIVERKDTNLAFALKYIRKDEGMSSGVVLHRAFTVIPLYPSQSSVPAAPTSCRQNLLRLTCLSQSQSYDPRASAISFGSAECSNT